MIVLHASVVADHLRGRMTPEVKALFRLVDSDEEIVVGDLVLAELLEGCASAEDAARLEATLREFDLVEMVEDDLAVDAARHGRTLRLAGMRPPGLLDLMVATWCIRHRHALLHASRDFAPMERHLGLRVLRN